MLNTPQVKLIQRVLCVPAQSEQLAKFQVDLSGRKQAHITADVVDDVLRSISYLDDINPSRMARQTDTNVNTMSQYVRGECSPATNRFVRILRKLGYDLHIVKRNDSAE